MMLLLTVTNHHLQAMTKTAIIRVLTVTETETEFMSDKETTTVPLRTWIMTVGTRC